MRLPFIRLLTLHILLAAYLWLDATAKEKFTPADVLEQRTALFIYAAAFTLAAVGDVTAIILDAQAASAVAISIDLTVEIMLLVVLVSDVIILKHNPFFLLIWTNLVLSTIVWAIHIPDQALISRSALDQIERVASQTVQDHPEFLRDQTEGKVQVDE